MPSKYTTVKRTRQRWVAPYHSFPATGPTSVDTYTQTWSNDLLISGGNHGSRVRRGLSGQNDTGGNFLVHKRSYEEQLLKGNEDVHFSGSTNPLAAGTPHFIVQQWPYRNEWNNSHFTMPSPSTDLQLNALGTTAIANTVPTTPKFGLATFLGEAREGIPSAIGLSLTGKARARQARNAGDEYLNYEFGWKPLVRDVQNFAWAVKNSEEALSEYHKGSGVAIKRRYNFPVKLEVKEGSMGNKTPLPILATGNYSGGAPELRTITTSKTEQWFTATYMYFVPPEGTPARFLSDANKLLGVKLTPEVLWNLAPWSWAADWAANMGDIMKNLSALQTDSLAIHHAYIMEHKTIKVEYFMKCKNLWVSHPGTHVIRQTFIGETKKRLAATPYGFGLNWNGFSKRQLGILAALGISRAR